MIENHIIQQLRALPIEGVAGRLGLHVQRHKSLCPFHDDSRPSLTFNVSHNSYRCFVCDAHGGPIDLVMNHLHLSFQDACKWLADGSNVILEQWKPSNPVTERSRSTTFKAERYAKFFEKPYLNDSARRFLFSERHLDPRVIRWCRLTSFRNKGGINWLQIPYYDIDGHLTGIQNRNLDYGVECRVDGVGNSLNPKPSSLNLPRFMFPKGSQCHIYNLNILKLLKPTEPLYICEGCSDCWAMLSAGHKAIAIPSATLLKPQDLKPLETLSLELGTSFHMYPDQDAPGERLFLELKERIPDLIHHQLPEGCKDFSDYYMKTLTPYPL